MTRADATRSAAAAADAARDSVSAVTAIAARARELGDAAGAVVVAVERRLEDSVLQAVPALRTGADDGVARCGALLRAFQAHVAAVDVATVSAGRAARNAEQLARRLKAVGLLRRVVYLRLGEEAADAAAVALDALVAAQRAVGDMQAVLAELTETQQHVAERIAADEVRARAVLREAASSLTTARQAAADAKAAADLAEERVAETEQLALEAEAHPDVTDEAVARATAVRDLADAASTAARDARRASHRADRSLGYAARAYDRIEAAPNEQRLLDTVERLERHEATTREARDRAWAAVEAAEVATDAAARKFPRSARPRRALVRAPRLRVRSSARPAPSAEIVLSLSAVSALLASVVRPAVGIGFLAVAVIVLVARAFGTFTSLIVTYALVLFVVPSRYTLQPYALSASALVALVVAVLWLSGRTRPEGDVPLRRQPVVVTILLLLLYLFTSYGLGHLHPMLPPVVRAADRNLLLLFAFTAVAVAAADGLRDRHQLYRVLGVIVAGAGITATIGVLQFVSGWDIATALRPPGFGIEGGIGFIYERAGFPRVAGTARNPIEMGVVWAATIPLALHLAAHARSRLARRSSLLCAGLLVLALPMALSRSSIAALVIALVLLLPSWSPQRRFRLVTGGLVVFAAVTITFASLIGALGQVLTGAEGSQSLATRGKVRAAAVEMASDARWFGHGFGTYAPAATTCNAFASRTAACVIDNLYSVQLIEIGYVGVGVFLGAFGVGAVMARRVRKRSPRAARGDLAQSLMAGMIAMLAAGWGLNHMRYPMVGGLLFLYLGLIGAVHRQSLAAGADAGADDVVDLRPAVVA